MIPLYDPERQPIQGMFPALEHSRIPHGGWKRLENIRIWAGGVSVRDGSTLLAAKSLRFRDSVLSMSPKCYLELEDTSGATADSSGNGNTGAVSGSITRRVAGGVIYETTYGFQFASGTVTVTHAASLNVTRPSIVLVFQPTSSVNCTLVEKGTAFSVKLTASGNIEATFNIDGTNRTLTAPYSVGAWHCVVFSYDGTEVVLAVNGKTVKKLSVSGFVSTNSSNMVIGSGFVGTLDDVALCATGLGRDAAKYVSAVPISGYRALGMTVASLDDLEHHVYTAVFVGDRTRVYRTSLDSGGFTEITAVDNGHGIMTRLSARPLPVSFALVLSRSDSTRRLFFVDKDSAPRFWDGTTSWRHERVPRPDVAPHAVLFSGGYIKVNDPGGQQLTINTSGVGMFAAAVNLDDSEPAGQSGNAVIVKVQDNVQNNASVAIRLANGTTRPFLNAERARQLWLFLRKKEGSWQWLQAVKIEIADDNSGSPGTWKLVHDPKVASGAVSSRLIPVGSGEEFNVLVCSLDDVPDTNKDALAWVRFTWVDPTQTGAGATFLYKFWLIAFAISGNVPGFARYALSYASSKMLSQSPPRVQERDNKTAGLDLLGGVYTWAIPESQYMLYVAYVQAYMPSSPTFAHKVDTFRLYRKDVEEEEFYFVKDENFESVFQAGSGLSVIDNLERLKKSFDRLMPSERAHGIPVCAMLAAIGGRLWAVGAREGADVQPVIAVVAGKPTKLKLSYHGGISAGINVELRGFAGAWAPLNGTRKVVDVWDDPLSNWVSVDFDSTGFGSYSAEGSLVPSSIEGRVMFSRFGDAFEFSPDVTILPTGDIDDDSPGEHALSGETPISLAGVSQAGVDGITLWTNENIYVTGGTLTRHILKLSLQGPHGIASQHAFTRYLTNIFWVDPRGYVYAGGVTSGMTSLSGRILDGVLDAEGSSMAYYRERLYLCARDQTVDKRLVFVFDTRFPSWVADSYAVPITFIASGRSLAQEVLVGFGEDAAIYLLDVPGALDDAGSPVRPLLESRRLAPFGLDQTGVVGAVKLLAGPGSGILEVTKTAFPSGSSVEGQIQLDPLASAARYEKHATDGSIEPTVMCNGVVVSISGTASPNMTLHGIYAAAEVRTDDAATG